ncbi:MAG: hypothetical protein ACUVRJ_10405, partial [Candidatus Villigracilaceae bacterium]
AQATRSLNRDGGRNPFAGKTGAQPTRISRCEKKSSDNRLPNGPHYRRRVGLDSFAKRKNLKPEPTDLDGMNPAVRVHALIVRRAFYGIKSVSENS